MTVTTSEDGFDTVFEDETIGTYTIKEVYTDDGVDFVSDSSDGFGSKFLDPGRFGSAIFGLGIGVLGLENFPKKLQIFQFFPFVSKSTQIKDRSGSYLLRA